MRIWLIINGFLFSVHACAQKAATSKYLSFDDLSNFWRAYDRVIVNLNYTDNTDVYQFFLQSGYEKKLKLNAHT